MSALDTTPATARECRAAACPGRGLRRLRRLQKSPPEKRQPMLAKRPTPRREHTIRRRTAMRPSHRAQPRQSARVGVLVLVDTGAPSAWPSMRSAIITPRSAPSAPRRCARATAIACTGPLRHRPDPAERRAHRARSRPDQAPHIMRACVAVGTGRTHDPVIRDRRRTGASRSASAISPAPYCWR